VINKRKIIIYITITFGLAWGIFGFIFFTAKDAPLESLALTIALAMFAPAIATVIVKKYIYREPILSAYGFSFRRYEYIILAWLLPVILSLAAAAATIALGLAKFDPGMGEFVKLFPQNLQERGIPPYYVIFLFSLFLPVVINSFFTIGEELGWRGFLQDELKSLGQIKSYLLIGVIWGIWHAPIVAMGHNYPGHPILGPVWMVIFSILLSFIFGWLKDSAKSVWAPVIAHASLNGPAMIPLVVLSGLDRLLGGILGVTGFVVMGGFVAWLIYSGKIK
jgi:membrane protease YdiL (CAAX protease family)